MRKILFYPLFFWVLYSLPSHAEPANIPFSVTPGQCVALHKGQSCYQEVLFQWQTPETGRYCLFNQATRQQLVCWQGRYADHYRYSFRGTKTTKFSLVHLGEDQPLAEVKLVVTWVYKAPKQSQSGWRLF